MVPRTIWSAVLAVHTQAEMQFHGLVKLGEFHLLDEGNSFFERSRVEFDLLGTRPKYFLPVLRS
jgi:hypothetical protein